MKKLLISESQVKLLIENLLNEVDTNVREFTASTDPERIYHDYLTTQFGLPNGKNYETYYYTSNISSVINQSLQPRKTFLSVFKPLNDAKTYVDFISVGNKQNSLSNEGSKSFNFKENSNIIASHNGLLAIARLMDQLRGKSGMVTITFKSIRRSTSIDFNDTNLFDLTQSFRQIQQYMAFLAVQNKSKTLFGQVDNKTIQSRINILINNNASGFYGFLFNNMLIKDELFAENGYIKELNYNLTPYINSLIQLTYENDFNGNYPDTSKINETKKIGQQYTKDLSNKIIEAYKNNFQIFVNKYFPQSKDELIKKLSLVKINYVELGDTLFQVLTGKYTGPAPRINDFAKTERNYLSGL
jgi:hypothetical protein